MKTVVIAKYKENTEWVAGLNCPYVILEKGTYMPNVGRESSTYLKYIVDNYETLAGTYYFLQGNPFDHAPNIISTINGNLFNEYADLGNAIYYCDMDGSPQHSGLPIREAYKKFIKGGVPDQLRFVAGAQFAITAERLRAPPKEYYEQLLLYSCVEEKAPWVLERLWRYIFT